MVKSGDYWLPENKRADIHTVYKCVVTNMFIMYIPKKACDKYVTVYDGKHQCDYYSDWEGEKFASKGITFLEYTGLKDMSGTEIYEGDIVQVVHYDAYEVYYDPELAEFGYRNSNELFYGQFADERILLGNIYENRELLEAENVNNQV